MRYDLIDTETGNLCDRFPSEETALAFVRSLIVANGVEIVDTLMFGGRNDAGQVLPVQTGAALARRAHASTTERPPHSRRAS